MLMNVADRNTIILTYTVLNTVKLAHNCFLSEAILQDIPTILCPKLKKKQQYSKQMKEML